MTLEMIKFQYISIPAQSWKVSLMQTVGLCPQFSIEQMYMESPLSLIQSLFQEVPHHPAPFYSVSLQNMFLFLSDMQSFHGRLVFACPGENSQTYGLDSFISDLCDNGEDLHFSFIHFLKGNRKEKYVATQRKIRNGCRVGMQRRISSSDPEAYVNQFLNHFLFFLQLGHRIFITLNIAV